MRGLRATIMPCHCWKIPESAAFKKETVGAHVDEGISVVENMTGFIVYLPIGKKDCYLEVIVRFTSCYVLRLSQTGLHGLYVVTHKKSISIFVLGVIAG